MKKTQLIILLLIAMVAASCNKAERNGDLSIKVGYAVNGTDLVTDTLCYSNEAGNEFMITEIQWFISKMELQNEQGEWIALKHRDVGTATPDATSRIFYIDTNIPESQTLALAPIPIGRYKKLRFVFGLDEEYNKTGLFSDPPEANMFWPETLGGGYHYMKLNGRFVNAENELAPLNVHLGIGQNDSQTEFIHNHFTVELPIDLTISESTDKQLYLCMIIDNWFHSPNLYDFNEWGSAIMQNQAAQQALKENGHDVFALRNVENQNDIAMKKDDILKGFNGFMQKAAPKPHFWTWENVKQTLEQIKENNKKRS